MMQNSKKNLVLIGGGQTHAPVLKMLGSRSPKDISITLISANPYVPYSGMLPGYIAGLYTKEDYLIDLRSISHFANAIFIEAKITSLDLKNKLILLNKFPPISYDILSINVGIVPDMEGIVGKEYIAPIKPAFDFLHIWEDMLLKLKEGKYKNSYRAGILGAGAGGIETALAMQKRVEEFSSNVQIHIFQRGKEILPGLNKKTKQKVLRILNQKEIHLHLEEEITKITKMQEIYECKTSQKKVFPLDFIVGAVKAKSLDWIAKSDLAKNEKDFILVDDTLQSISHPGVFAVGDIATMLNYPRPKAGVFAVKQSIPLFKNLLNIIENKPLVKYKPQVNYLNLLNTADGRAIASRGNISLGASKWIWKWKNRIDTNFMKSFQILK